jgi:hypothetical protein
MTKLDEPMLVLYGRSDDGVHPINAALPGNIEPVRFKPTSSCIPPSDVSHPIFVAHAPQNHIGASRNLLAPHAPHNVPQNVIGAPRKIWRPKSSKILLFTGKSHLKMIFVLCFM